MAIEEEDFVQSDDDFDDKKHEKLLDKVLGINKAQQLKKASRTEPALQISEFDLAKSITGKKGIIHVGDLTNILQKKKTHAVIKKKVDNTNKISSTLPKPLEKIVSDKITRTVAYEKARLELDRWEPIVTANRVSTDLLFPLPVRDKDKNIDFTKKWRLKTAFDLEMEKNNPQVVEEIHVDLEKEKVKLTLEELRKMRSEQAKLRAHQSYQEAKARRQNKIKSKKYHRIQKKAKIKQQLKEFEELQKTKPEEALKRLEEIERIRAQERFTLRHKSTGKWAKNKQIHAKYDKESRAELAEQLRLSKELTQKTNIGSDSEDEFVPQEVEVDTAKQGILWSDNNLKSDAEVSNFINSYKKFYSETTSKSEENHSLDSIQDDDVDEDLSEEENVRVEEQCTKTDKTEDKVEETSNKHDKKEKHIKVKKVLTVASNQATKATKKSQKQKRASLNTSSTSDWDVELLENDNIDLIFDKLEKKMGEKLKRETNKLKKQSAPSNSSNKKRKQNVNVEEKESLLALPIQKKRPRLDEPLLQTTGQDEPLDGELTNLNNILKKNVYSDKNKVASTEENKIESAKKKPVKKVTQLDTIMPDIITNIEDDDDENDNLLQQELKEEAADVFQTDLVEEFANEKAKTIEKDKPKDVNLLLPGWGSWGGVGVVPSKRKKRRFILKAPKKVPRKDDNKGFLIINEDADKKAKQHMVDELPFPFQRVKDFEASIRAPIGRTFVPETAFRKLTKPAVKTKIGAIIEPMDKDVILKKPNI